LEANHDAQLLHDNKQYPASLKRRIAGRHGHLSNEAAAQILAKVDKRRLKRLHAAHLSQQNNDVALVLESFRQVLAAGASPELGVATQEAGFDWVRLKFD
jgi:phosphoribosyl 1,2-cyclic phosphodiesterase